MTDNEVNNEPSTVDPMSPYYLGGQDGPGAIITHVKLRSDNYEEWSRSLRMSLKSRRKFGFCDGTITKPTDKSALENWEVVNCTIVQWIMNTIDPTLKDNISYFEEAQPLWNDLKDRFAVVDGSKIHSLKTQIANCKQTKGWRAPPPVSHGLDDSLYGTVRSQQLLLDPLPTLNRAYHVVLQEERLRGVVSTHEDPSNFMAFAVKSEHRLKSKSEWRDTREREKQEKLKLYCTHCNTRGHDVRNCFILNGYPEWWGDRPRVGVGRGTSGATSSTNPSKTAFDTAKGGQVRANIITFGDGVGHNTDTTTSTHRFSGMYREWIIDTGASHHVTGDITCLTDTKDITTRSVGLPDGQNVMAKLMGTVCLNDRLVLRDVLFVPCLTCNLISVSQLIAENNYELHFNKSLCVVPDHTLKMTIGVGELRDGLYYFREVLTKPVIYQVSKPESFELWHQRLGHPADKIVKLIPMASHFSSNDRKVCDVCHQAKQHRHSFHLSDHIANDIFDLIHCDLWGPYRIPSSCGAKYFLTIVDDYSRSVWVAITDGLIIPTHVPTQDQLADLFTKALGKQQFDRLIHKLGILDLHAPV
ncbi:hypothetical protein RND81_11G196400 [Saponaria officinalis]|uniref:Polyprotein n=1 Tax=Saponaria officinalis TaxID=3572 RepID=A0AAW1HPL2_SAPOF